MEIKYYVCGHTAEGFVNYLSSNLSNINKTFILKHPSNEVKTAVLNKLIAYYKSNYSLEILISPESKEQLNGIIIRDISLAVIDAQIVTSSIDQAVMISMQDDVPNEAQKLLEKKQLLNQEAYEYFQEGLKIHDLLENIYIKEMDFHKADKIVQMFMNELFANKVSRERKAQMYERLFGTNTPEGMINFLEHLINPIENRIFIKGRAGTGKSVFMKKVLDACIKNGIDTELYRCSFDPNSIDMLIIRELDYCLFDSTPPHELFPERKNDQLIDLYEAAVTPGTDGKYKEEIQSLTRAYKEKTKMGLEKLKETKEIEKKREAILVRTNNEVIEETFQKIINEK